MPKVTHLGQGESAPEIQVVLHLGPWEKHPGEQVPSATWAGEDVDKDWACVEEEGRGRGTKVKWRCWEPALAVGRGGGPHAFGELFLSFLLVHGLVFRVLTYISPSVVQKLTLRGTCIRG